MTMSIQRYDWKRLNRQQVGAYVEYFVKMELTMYGGQVFTTEVDDRGIKEQSRMGAECVEEEFAGVRVIRISTDGGATCCSQPIT